MQQDQQYEDLVRQAQAASEEVRRQLVDKLVMQFTDAAYRWALVILEDEDKASDALQEAWLNAFLHLDQLQESAAFPAWFRQLVQNSCYRVIRDEKPALPLEDQLPLDSAPHEDLIEAVESKERSEYIRDALSGLPEHERIVTELYYFADYPQQEIAEVLSVPLTTVKKRLQYARRHLKGIIQPDIVSQLAALNGGCTAAAFVHHMDIDDLWVELPIYKPMAVGTL
ncbi:MAG: sigma-70 family RNA polymerase sigma factor [Chloroflexota bacterium]